MMLFRKWHEQILGRFPQREPLSLEESLRAHWTEFNQNAAKAVLELIEDEYGIPAGTLRPSDPLRLLLEPVKVRNPLQWLFFQSRSEDLQSELEYQLRRRGNTRNPAQILTIGDYVSAWQTPEARRQNRETTNDS
jgi:hypothetical protein